MFQYTPRLFPFIGILSVLFLTTFVSTSHASGCFQDPVYEHNWTAVVTTGARVRDVACMDGSTVLKTLNVGSSVALIAETDGWYKIRDSSGTEGWVGQWLVRVEQTPWTGAVSSAPVAVIPTPTTGPMSDRLKGYILLQVESHGEAWYVHPSEKKRYYMKNGEVAYEMMRKFGLGITTANLNKLKAGDATLSSQLRGKILLQVDAHGEAYYVHPKTGTVTYMKDGPAAYAIMREQSLGITNRDLETISPAELISTSSNTSTSTVTTSTTPVSTPVSSTTSPTIAGCSVFPSNNPWNQDVSQLPVHPLSSTYIASIGLTSRLHPDMGENQDYGIPYNVVPSAQPKVSVNWTAYGDESDAGPYPIPANAKRETSSDHHVLVVDRDACMLYELYNASPASLGAWNADSGAVWNLSSNALRPEGWTSADAAGLPILPGLVRYDEVASGAIHHAIRFTAPRTQSGWMHPATHAAGSNNASLPPMGLRVRLKADYDISGLSGQALVIATAMKTYGMMLADNGSAWYFTGATDPGWNDDELNQLKQIPGSAFEAVDTGEEIRKYQ